MKVLFTTPVLEYPPAGGPQLRIANSIKALNAISELHIISRVNSSLIGGITAKEYFANQCNNFEFAPSTQDGIIDKILRIRTSNSFINRILDFSLRFIRIIKIKNNTENDALFIANYTKKNGIQVVWFGYGNVSFQLMRKVRKLLPNAKLVCDTDSVWSRFLLREIESISNSRRIKNIKKRGKKKEFEEKEWQSFMDVTTAVSQVDADYYKSIASNPNKVKLFSNVIDPLTYSTPPPPPNNFKSPSIYLAGSFWLNSPMEQAARWVITEILPLVILEIPNIHLYIIGNGSDKILSDIDQKNITITGKLKTVLPYLCNTNVSLVPLKFESGTRYKILEAGACGTPIVSTSLGAEGIDITDGLDILIADTPKEFAESIIKIIRNKELSFELAKNCKQLILDKYSVDYLTEEGKSILNFLKD